MHIIQKQILETLTFHEIVRFAALRPLKVESNLYSYHLKLLIKDGYINKTNNGYTLAPKGLMHVDRISTDKFELRQQPKIITILVIENEKGEILLWRRNKQPFINTWSLISGKTHIDDPSIEAAALREAKEKIGLSLKRAQHVGDCYVKHIQDGETISAIFGHVFYAKCINKQLAQNTIWWKRGEALLPGSEKLINLTLKQQKNGVNFFEEIFTQNIDKTYII